MRVHVKTSLDKKSELGTKSNLVKFQSKFRVGSNSRVWWGACGPARCAASPRNLPAELSLLRVAVKGDGLLIVAACADGITPNVKWNLMRRMNAGPAC